MRAAVLLLLLGGCLIVETYQEDVGDVCPSESEQPDVLGGAAGPIALSGDQIYYLRTPGTIARIGIGGGAITDLVTVDPPPLWLVVDASSIYWAGLDNIIWKAPLTGAVSTRLVEGIVNLTALAVDDVGLVYAAEGLYRVRHADGVVEPLAEAQLVSGLAHYAGTYFFADVALSLIRRAPPLADLAMALYPGPVVADDRAVYYYEHGEATLEANGAIRLVTPEGGGTPIPTLENMRGPVVAMVMDADDLYFAIDVTGDYRIKRVSRFGGKSTVLACRYVPDAPVFLAHDEAYVYWSDTSKLYRRAK